MGRTPVERHADVCKELNALYALKNHDYGDSFHKTFLEEGFAMARIRLSDKLERFKTLSRNVTAHVQNESIRDTLLDIANYAIMTVMEIDGCEENTNTAESCKHDWKCDGAFTGGLHYTCKLCGKTKSESNYEYNIIFTS